MLTRLRVNGFKNLVNVDVHFGPFTCIAGANGVGKSNLFDAIRFLSDLTHMPLLEAAKSVRSEGQKNSDIRDLFHKIGDEYEPQMQFVADMIIPKKGVDDLGQEAKASITTVRYELVLNYRQGDGLATQGLLEIDKEELKPISLQESRRIMRFITLEQSTPSEQTKIRNQEKQWQNSVIDGRRTVPFISTEEGIINFHQDGGSSGKPFRLKAAQLQRTVLSTANALEKPTALLVKNEMKSWQMLQLEPGALRRSDEFNVISTARLGSDGSHLPATLYRLKLENEQSKQIPDVYQTLANKLSELVEQVAGVDVERDDRREMLTLMLRGKDGTVFPARSLSDGTLRFLGLAVLELDQKSGGVVCLEEPENGIHPDKIGAILQLLKDMCTDISQPVGDDNPLRQVIINTHSPSVVQLVEDDNLLVAERKEAKSPNGIRFSQVVYSPLESTWRTKIENNTYKAVSMGMLLGYLLPPNAPEQEGHWPRKRVRDRPDVKRVQQDTGQYSLF
ncbi:AAA family ATPase [Rudanella paleaurantiibacter]|uniref:AAA family ATPase n=1 Tax=Rudanella paleaurantiibacter TaxID=2614655 RepID=A0A7J5TYW9_9BACT|nr:ATP-binding protein [Rudanella paleaurantiibacter]KAB7729106.1 AAA family ATPase [Rudanella paleaurantiibacter]